MFRPFLLLDVFGAVAFGGNPLAVVRDAGGLTTDDMLTITRWLNLSETTFVLPPEHPDADYRVRIFTPESELPFAGHPTLGTCQAWLHSGGVPKRSGEVVQECEAGLIRVRMDGERLAFAAPPVIRSGPVEADYVAEIAAVLRVSMSDIVEAQWVDNGPGWVAVRLASAEAVLALAPNFQPDGRFYIGAVGAYPAGSEAAFEIRGFFADVNGDLREDPVTGSLNASVAQWLLGTGVATAPYVAAQGTCLGRTGRVYVTQADGEVWIGGEARVMFEGMAL